MSSGLFGSALLVQYRSAPWQELVSTVSGDGTQVFAVANQQTQERRSTSHRTVCSAAEVGNLCRHPDSVHVNRIGRSGPMCSWLQLANSAARKADCRVELVACPIPTFGSACHFPFELLCADLLTPHMSGFRRGQETRAERALWVSNYCVGTRN